MAAMRFLRLAPLLLTVISTASAGVINSTTTSHTTTSVVNATVSGASTYAVHVTDTKAPNPAALATPVSAKTYSFGGAAATEFYSPAFVPKGKDALLPALSQSETNGESDWGTFNAPKVNPSWVSAQALPSGTPWGGATANNTNYYDNVPNTGTTRYYDFTISESTIAPDGVEKLALLINGAFPGPMIEANWGDMIQVTLHNGLSFEGTALHWHGLLQKETPYYDGVPAVGMCPVAPGQSFTYTFRADLYGTSWYHSHYSAQYSGGALGPMIIHGPKNAAYDIDLGPVLLTDWYHASYQTLVDQVMTPGAAPPASNNNLINGKMNYPCSETNATCTPNAGISKFKFQSGKKHRLRLINASAEGIQKFSIDGYKMTVIANDFVPIEPYVTDLITLGVAQRTDIIVEATGSSTDAVWMRSNLSAACTVNDGISPQAVAAIYYENANTSALPTTQPLATITTARLDFCGNDDLSLTVPYYPIEADATTSLTVDYDITFQTNSTGFSLWYVNNSTFRADYNDPLLLEAKLGKTTFPGEWNVYNMGENATVRFVVYNYFQFAAHPMHLHGHNMMVIAEGTGTWDGHTTNMANPQRRDVQLIQPAVSATEPSYFVMQYTQDNPGTWPLHCHIAWHVSAGLYINLLERPAEIESSSIPSTMAQTCRDWAAWTGSHVVPEIDSGL